MPHYGDEELQCHIGLHSYSENECVYCNYRLKPEPVSVIDGEISPFSLE